MVWGVSMKRQCVWLAWVCLGVEALALIYVVGWIANTLIIPDTGRYFQLFMALIASGMLIHTFRRWLAEGEREILEPTGSETGKFQWIRRMRRVTWVAWLGLAGVAWAVVSRPLWHHMQDTQAKVNSTGLTPEIYLAVLGLIVTAVTAFYLVILHRTTDKAEETLEKLGAYHDVLERLIKDDQHLVEQLNKQGIVLRNKILLPMLTYLAMKNPADSQLLQPHQNILQTEISLFHLGKAEDLIEFRRLLNDVAAYQPVLRNHPDDFTAHFALIERRLDHFTEEYGVGADRQEIQKMRRELNRLQTG